MAFNLFRAAVLAVVTFAGYYYFLVDFNVQHRGLRAPTATPVAQFCKTAGQVALTFDEGPSEFTQYVLEALQAVSVTATFHVVTKYFKSDVATVTNVQVAAKAGHVIGLRWPTQINPTDLSDDTLVKTLIAESDAIYQAIGKYPKFLRLPSGTETDQRVVGLVQQQGFVVSAWNIDTNDFTPKIADDVVAPINTTLDKMAPGAGRFIVLQHDLSQIYQDPTVVAKVVSAVKTRGYSTVTMDSCLGQSDPYRSSNVDARGGSAGGSTTNTGGGSGASVGGKSDGVAVGVAIANWLASLLVSAVLMLW